MQFDNWTCMEDLWMGYISNIHGFYFLLLWWLKQGTETKYEDSEQKICIGELSVIHSQTQI